MAVRTGHLFGIQFNGLYWERERHTGANAKVLEGAFRISKLAFSTGSSSASFIGKGRRAQINQLQIGELILIFFG